MKRCSIGSGKNRLWATRAGGAEGPTVGKVLGFIPSFEAAYGEDNAQDHSYSTLSYAWGSYEEVGCSASSSRPQDRHGGSLPLIDTPGFDDKASSGRVCLETTDDIEMWTHKAGQGLEAAKTVMPVFQESAGSAVKIARSLSEGHCSKVYRISIPPITCSDIDDQSDLRKTGAGEGPLLALKSVSRQSAGYTMESRLLQDLQQPYWSRHWACRGNVIDERSCTAQVLESAITMFKHSRDADAHKMRVETPAQRIKQSISILDHRAAKVDVAVLELLRVSLSQQQTQVKSGLEGLAYFVDSEQRKRNPWHLAFTSLNPEVEDLNLTEALKVLNRHRIEGNIGHDILLRLKGHSPYHVLEKTSTFRQGKSNSFESIPMTTHHPDDDDNDGQFGFRLRHVKKLLLSNGSQNEQPTVAAERAAESVVCSSWLGSSVVGSITGWLLNSSLSKSLQRTLIARSTCVSGNANRGRSLGAKTMGQCTNALEVIPVGDN